MRSALLASVIAILIAPAARAAVPSVRVASAFLFNSNCAGEAADPAARDELESREAAFAAAWAAEGPLLLAETERVTGIPFPFDSVDIALTSCRIPSMSLPLIVNARPYLAAAGGAYALDSGVYVDTLFHEILHRYVDRAVEPGRTSALLTRYALESGNVRSHLWLQAIETLVYRRLGRLAELDASIADERKLKSGGQLTRGREIVAREGAEAVVADFRTAALKR